MLRNCRETVVLQLKCQIFSFFNAVALREEIKEHLKETEVSNAMTVGFVGCA